MVPGAMLVTSVCSAWALSATACCPIFTSVLDTSETVNSEPPRKSMPNFSPPPNTGMSTEMTTRAAAMLSHRRRLGTKGMEVFPV